MATSSCYGCGAEIEIQGPVGRRDTCPECDADLHACINCRHYDESAPHQCREPHAEPVVDKESSNACDLFQMGDGASRRRGSRAQSARDALGVLFGERPRREDPPADPLEALFRKR